MDLFYERNAKLFDYGSLLKELKSLNLKVFKHLQFKRESKLTIQLFYTFYLNLLIFSKIEIIETNCTMLNEDLIGQIYCSHETLFQKLDKKKPDYFDFNFDPHRIIKLNNKNLLISGNLNGLSLYDSNLKLIHNINQIGHFKPIQTYGMASDKYGNVFVSNALFKSILKLDQNLKFIKAKHNAENQAYGKKYYSIDDDIFYLEDHLTL